MKSKIAYIDWKGEYSACPHDERIITVPNCVSCLQLIEEDDVPCVVIPYQEKEFTGRSPYDLCASIKAMGKKITLIFTMEYFHRPILEKISRTGADFLWIGKELTLEILAGLPEEENLSTPEELLSNACPYLWYEPYGLDKEIIFCRAYGCRLVVNSIRLDFLCSKEKHRKCDYFREPRLRP